MESNSLGPETQETLNVSDSRRHARVAAGQARAFLCRRGFTPITISTRSKRSYFSAAAGFSPASNVKPANPANSSSWIWAATRLSWYGARMERFAVSIIPAGTGVPAYATARTAKSGDLSAPITNGLTGWMARWPRLPICTRAWSAMR